MSSIAACVKKHCPDRADILETLQNNHKAHRDDGIEAQEAKRKSVADALAEYEAEREKIMAQVMAKMPKTEVKKDDNKAIPVSKETRSDKASNENATNPAKEDGGNIQGVEKPGQVDNGTEGRVEVKGKTTAEIYEVLYEEAKNKFDKLRKKAREGVFSYTEQKELDESTYALRRREIELVSFRTGIDKKEVEAVLNEIDRRQKGLHKGNFPIQDKKFTDAYETLSALRGNNVTAKYDKMSELSSISDKDGGKIYLRVYKNENGIDTETSIDEKTLADTYSIFKNMPGGKDYSDSTDKKGTFKDFLNGIAKGGAKISSPKLSQSIPPSTRANTPAELRAKLGAGYDALVKSGRLRIVATQKEAQRIIDMIRGGVKYATSEQVKAFRIANNLPEIQMRKDGSHPTQIASTKSTYRKIFDNLIPEENKGGKIIDYGAGKNIGGKELGADTFEPYPEAGFSPTYNKTENIKSGSYQTVINNAVLNVVPDDVRDGIVKEIGRILAPGGKAYINVRGKDVFNAKHHVIDSTNQEVIIDGTGAYQKGFNENELVKYLQGVLGEGYSVVGSSSKFGAVSAIISKNETVEVLYSEDGKTIQGFAANGISYLVEDGIAGGKAWPVLVHELGTHINKVLLDDKNFKAILAAIDKRKDEQSATGKAIRDAIKAVPKDTKPENRQEEMLAYLLENHPETSIVRRIIALIKQALVKLGFKDVSVFTVADLRAMAEIAVRREAQAAARGTDAYIAFNKTQIKSIFNQGTWDGTNADINFSFGGAKANSTGLDTAQKMERENADIYFSEAPPPIGSTQEELAADREKAYQANRAQNRDLKRKAVRNVRSALGKMSQGVDKYLGAISTRLRNISPKLEARLRKLDFDTATNLAADNKAVLPLLQKAKKMSANDFADWDRARKNGDTEKINELIKKYDLAKEYAVYRETLNNLRDEANEVGLDISFIKEYAPRVIKDAQGFLNAVGKGDMRPVITDALNRRADQMGITVAEMSPEQKADIISQMLFGGHPGIGRPGNAKERTIKEIPVELDQYYMDSDGALVNYLHSIRKNVEIRKFFGKVSTVVAKAKSAMRQAESRLRKALAEEEDQYATLHQDHKKGMPFPESERIKGIRETIAEYKNILDKYNTERGYAPFISEYVLELMSNGTIDPIKNPEAEQILVNIMQARFHEKGTHGFVQGYKNLSYIDTMGSPFSAITQIGDLAWTIYENGWYRTAKAALGSITKKSRITKEDVGIERIAQEFADSDTMSKAVAKVFKWVGLEKMDAIGKESFLNAALERFEDQAKKNPEALKKKISDIFEDETDNVIDDLQNKRITDNVKLLVYSNLLDFQPAALSEQSEQYLKAGNGRVFYMLKSYTLKQFDVFRREVYNTYKNGDSKQKIEAIRNMVYLAALISMANAGADEIKDLILGRKTSIEDRVTDNILRLFGVSKYVTWQARTDGAGTAAAKQILPPFKFLNAAYKDLLTTGDEKGLEMVGSIPVIGKLAYWHMGRGSYNNKDYSEQKFSDKKRTLNSIKDKVEADPKLRGKYIKELAQLKAVNKVQARMNEQTKRINKLKASEKLTGRDNSKIIENLEKQKIKLAENYLKASK
jgi:SAM-dependent methyltransferase